MIRIEDFSNELVRSLLSVLETNVLSIIVYGSVAKGTNLPDSDVDIAVIVNRELDKSIQDRLSNVIVDLNLQYDTVFSVVDIDKNSFDEWGNISPFYINVKREGITLWTTA